jgi:hypothetical protein
MPSGHAGNCGCMASHRCPGPVLYSRCGVWQVGLALLAAAFPASTLVERHTLLLRILLGSLLLGLVALQAGQRRARGGMGLGGRQMQGPAARAAHRSCLHPASRSVSQPPRQSATQPASQATHPPTPPPSQPATHPGTQPTHPPLQSLACIHAKRRSSHQRSARLQGGTGREHQQGGRTETRLRSGGSGPGGGPGTRRHSWLAGWASAV